MTNRAVDGMTGKHAVITGAGRGIGLAIARRFAAAGAAVALVSRTAAQVRSACAEIAKEGGRAIALPADVSDAGAVTCMVDAAHREFGRIDYLVNNAGIAPVAGIAEISLEDFDSLVATTIRGMHLCTRAVWPHMKAAGGGGIINISSMASFDPFPGLAVYGAAKAFVNAYTKAIAIEGAAVGIRAYGIAPGAVETDMLREAFPDYPGEKCLASDDVAALAESLLSPACRHSSGQTIAIRKD